MKVLRSVNPATGEEIATFQELSESELEGKLSTAMRGFEHWRATDLAERSALLRSIAAQFDANKDRLARTVTLEMGKTIGSAVAEVEKCVAGFHHYADQGPALLVPERQTLKSGSVETRWLPLGAILAIMPWNFPYWQVVRFLAPTIMAGNVGLLKHAGNVQGVARLIEDMVAAADAPPGVFQTLPIGVPAIAPLIADDRIAAVTLTGSERAGAAVAEQAGRALKKLVLELGGSDPFIVMPSADLEQAAKTAVRARIQNSGQSCICAKRMIIHNDIYDAFLDRFAGLMAQVKAGDPFDPATDMGPLSSHQQRETVLDQVARAQQEGARLLFGGTEIAGPGAFMSAGILVDVPATSAVGQEEIFGPVATVYRANDIDDAIRIANAIPYGLGSSVWTNDPKEQERLVADVAAGMTAVNQMLASTPEAPFGGIKRSGYGRELGRYGLHEFMNLKTVALPA
jgi:succinate-semialdehyde dehydrogenase/glutarate-semialdehyde dehydrogenase